MIAFLHSMTARHKALLWSNVSLLLVLLGISLGMRQPLLQQFAVLERKIMTKQIARLSEAIVQDAERLNTLASAEASWTEMHMYLGAEAKDADPHFYYDNYGYSVGEWGYEVLGLFDRNDQLRHLDTLNVQTGEMRAAPIELRRRFIESSKLRRFPYDDDPALVEFRNIFILETDDQPLLVASAPVLQSTDIGPRHGAVVVGRSFNSVYLDELVRNTTLKVELVPIALSARSATQGDQKIPSKFANLLKTTGEIAIVNNQWLASEIDLFDANAQAIYRLRVKAPRQEFQEGRAMLNKLTFILFTVGMTLGAVISWLLNRNFLHQQTLQASQAALHLTNLELEKLVNLDGLTQVANRRWFEIYLQQEWSRALRKQTPLTLILCDIDYFKRFNDVYGHLAGDACLFEVAQVLKRALKRPTDLIARYGGEEFAIILPDCTLEGGAIFAQQILEQIRELKIDHRGSPSDALLSISCGVASVTPQAHSCREELIEQSDQNLYLAKHRGRNQVCAQKNEDKPI